MCHDFDLDRRHSTPPNNITKGVRGLAGDKSGVAEQILVRLWNHGVQRGVEGQREAAVHFCGLAVRLAAVACQGGGSGRRDILEEELELELDHELAAGGMSGSSTAGSGKAAALAGLAAGAPTAAAAQRWSRYSTDLPRIFAGLCAQMQPPAGAAASRHNGLSGPPDDSPHAS